MIHQTYLNQYFIVCSLVNNKINKITFRHLPLAVFISNTNPNGAEKIPETNNLHQSQLAGGIN